VTGSNAEGSDTVASNATATVPSSGTGVPRNTRPPSISGSTTAGSILRGDPGAWNGAQPITFTYQWTVCDGNGSQCHDIANATSNTYVLKADDAGNTVRVRVTAKNSTGTTAATSAPSAKIATGTGTGGGGTGTNGCPAPSNGASVPVTSVAMPARLQVAQFAVTSGPLRKSSTSFTARFKVTDTCGRAVSGALVLPAAVPYNQFTSHEAATDSSGWVTMTFNRRAGFPASAKQQQLTMFVRARKPGESLLAGVSTRRLISFLNNR
jgi:hypothetical protein